MGGAREYWTCLPEKGVPHSCEGAQGVIREQRLKKAVAIHRVERVRDVQLENAVSTAVCVRIQGFADGVYGLRLAVGSAHSKLEGLEELEELAFGLRSSDSRTRIRAAQAARHADGPCVCLTRCLDEGDEANRAKQLIQGVGELAIEEKVAEVAKAIEENVRGAACWAVRGRGEKA